MNTSTVSSLALGLLGLSGFASAATITVNSTADPGASGICTLRDAIIAANSNAASNGCTAGEAAPADTIAFDIPAGDANCDGTSHVCTIALSSQLPDITEAVVIDGYSEPGASANSLAVGDDATVLIRLDASNLSGNTALQLTGGSDGSSVMGLCIVKPGDANNLGYMLKVISNDTTVAGNFIGVEPDGATLSASQIIFTALWIQGSGNTVGGTTPGARNLIANDTTDAIDVARSSNAVEGNYIDLDASGSHAIGSAGTGVNTYGNGDQTISGNVIGAWQAQALFLASSVFNPGAIIAQGNYIGTDATGTVALAGAGSYGIVLAGTDGVITIGGSTPGAGNLVRAATFGIYVHGVSTAGLPPVIQGNHIGVGLDGQQPLPSGTAGIFIDSGGGGDVVGGLIGGTSAGEGNVIAFNGASGVVVAQDSVHWTVLGNAIYYNGFGISLGGSDTPTPNDTDDVDTGANNLQNYPVLGAGVVGPATTVQVSGSLNSEANKTYRLEFFANAGCDASGHGQGKIFVGSTTVTTNPNDVSFGPIALTTPVDRHVITSTATDPDGNTSEFSDCTMDDTIFSDGSDGH